MIIDTTLCILETCIQHVRSLSRTTMVQAVSIQLALAKFYTKQPKQFTDDQYTVKNMLTVEDKVFQMSCLLYMYREQKRNTLYSHK